nr:PAS domain-containing protein [Deinococcus sp.]
MEERWKFALQGSGEGLWDWRPQSGDLYLSARWKDIVGYTDETLGTTTGTWVALIHPDDRPGLLLRYTEHVNEGTDSYEFEHRMQHRDGRWLWMLVRGRVSSRDEHGQPLRLIGTLRDIDERVRTQLELERARRDLKSILDHLPAMIGYWGRTGPQPLRQRRVRRVVRSETRRAERPAYQRGDRHGALRCEPDGDRRRAGRHPLKDWAG